MKRMIIASDGEKMTKKQFMESSQRALTNINAGFITLRYALENLGFDEELAEVVNLHSKAYNYIRELKGSVLRELGE